MRWKVRDANFSFCYFFRGPCQSSRTNGAPQHQQIHENSINHASLIHRWCLFSAGMGSHLIFMNEVSQAFTNYSIQTTSGCVMRKAMAALRNATLGIMSIFSWIWGMDCCFWLNCKTQSVLLTHKSCSSLQVKNCLTSCSLERPFVIDEVWKYCFENYHIDACLCGMIRNLIVLWERQFSEWRARRKKRLWERCGMN